MNFSIRSIIFAEYSIRVFLNGMTFQYTILFLNEYLNDVTHTFFFATSDNWHYNTKFFGILIFFFAVLPSGTLNPNNHFDLFIKILNNTIYDVKFAAITFYYPIFSAFTKNKFLIIPNYFTSIFLHKIIVFRSRLYISIN